MKSLFLTLLGIAATLSEASATTYYVSSTGSDSNAGTSTTTAWLTIGKANGITFAPGDQLLFESGKTFAGTLQLTNTDGGTAGNPVVIGSYGTGRATIDGVAGSALTVVGTTGVKISNLNFVALGRKTGNMGGSGIALVNANTVAVDQIEASNFQYAGVKFEGSANLRLTNIYAHDNGYAGLGGAGITVTPQNTNVYIGNCRTLYNLGNPAITNNHSGSGIIVSAATATIEYCESAYNGSDMQNTANNGPCGIWCVHSDNVTIQYCISHNNTSPAGKDDGGGFDIDGGVSNSTIQYCYAYENKNYGFMCFEYGAPAPYKWQNNTVRYNISANNTGAGLKIGYIPGANIPNGCETYSNVFYNDLNLYPAVLAYKGAPNFNFRNNVFVGSLTNVINTLVPDYPGFQYLANDYWCPTGGFKVNLGTNPPAAPSTTTYTSLTAWANATGQEKVGGTSGTLVGLNVDPKLTSPASYAKLTDPTTLPGLTSFLLQTGSPLIDSGLNLKNAPYSLNPGTRDFYGNTTPSGNGYDIGSHEKQSTALASTSATAPQALTCYPNPAADVLRVVLPADDAAATLTLHDQLGRVVLTRLAGSRAGAVEVNTGSVAAGLYLLRVQQAGRHYQQQVAINR